MFELTTAQNPKLLLCFPNEILVEIATILRTVASTVQKVIFDDSADKFEKKKKKKTKWRQTEETKMVGRKEGKRSRRDGTACISAMSLLYYYAHVIHRIKEWEMR